MAESHKQNAILHKLYSPYNDTLSDLNLGFTILHTLRHIGRHRINIFP